MRRVGRIARARGANLVEYLIVVGVVALASLAAVTAFSSSVEKKVDEERKCIESLACGGGGGGGLPGVGAGASGAEAPPPAANGPTPSTPSDGRKTWEATAAQSKNGNQKFFTAKAEMTGTRAELTASAADMTYKGRVGELNGKLYTGKVGFDWGGAKAEGAMIEAGAKSSVLGVPVEAKAAHMAGEAGFQLTKGPDGLGPKAGVGGWVAKGEVSGGEMDPKSSGNVKITLSGSALGAGATAGITFNDSDGDGHPEMEVTVKLGAVLGAGLQVRVESPSWLSSLMGWGKGPSGTAVAK